MDPSKNGVLAKVWDYSRLRSLTHFFKKAAKFRSIRLGSPFLDFRPRPSRLFCDNFDSMGLFYSMTLNRRNPTGFIFSIRRNYKREKHFRKMEKLFKDKLWLELCHALRRGLKHTLQFFLKFFLSEHFIFWTFFSVEKKRQNSGFAKRNKPDLNIKTVMNRYVKIAGRFFWISELFSYKNI